MTDCCDEDIQYFKIGSGTGGTPFNLLNRILLQTTCTDPKIRKSVSL